MAKLRLTKNLREKLRALADKQVRCPTEDAALAKAYSKAVTHFSAIVEIRYPAADMVILAKYDEAHKSTALRFQLESGGVSEFKFSEEDAPLVPSSWNIVGIADAKATEAYSDWNRARDALKSARETKLTDYRSLIGFARTLEDVTEIWPEAELVRSPTSFAVIALSTETIQRIKADVATHEKLAA